MTTETPLRVLQVLRAPVGGLFRHVADLTRGLVRRGVEVGLVVDAAEAGPRWEAVAAELAAIAPLGLTRTPMARRVAPNDLSAGRHVLGRVREQRIDVVHGHGAKGGAYARIAGTIARRGGRPARIYTPHGGSLHFAPRSAEGLVYHGLERMLARMSEAVVFESAFAKQGFADVLGLADPAWPVVPNGLAPEEFEPVPLAPDAADVLFLGEMRDLKGVDVLLDALDRLPGVTALLVGSGPDEAAYRARAAALGERVRFAAPMPAREAFARGRVVAVPSRKESLPYLVLEAAAAGKPLVATNVGGIPEIYGPDAHALVPPGDSAALGGALSAALADPERAAADAARLRARVGEVFNVETMVDSILNLYRSSLNRIPGGSV
jgi:glycosyltransferase involved in cell wall biosynthesis